MRTIGDNIKNARKSAGLTQNELAKLTSLPRSYIGDIEKNRYNPSVSTLNLISDANSTPVSDLIVKESTAEYGAKPIDLDTLHNATKVLYNGATRDLSADEQSILSTAIKTAMAVIDSKKK